VFAVKIFWSYLFQRMARTVSLPASNWGRSGAPAFPIITTDQGTSGGDSRATIHSLYGVRALAAAFIGIMHTLNFYANRGGSTLIEVREFFVSGGLGFVTPFFILSGLVLAKTHQAKFANTISPQAWYAFVQARLIRVYPLHVMSMVGFLLITAFWQGKELVGKNSLHYLWSHLALIHAWGINDKLTLNQDSWSISALFACYLIFPLLAWLKSGWQGSSWLLLALSATLFAFLANVGGLESGHDYGAVRAIAGFLVGVIIYEKVLVAKVMVPFPSLIQLLTITVLFAGFFAHWHPLISIVLQTILVVSVIHDKGILARVLASRPLVSLGMVSFSFYIWHYPVSRLLIDSRLISDWVFDPSGDLFVFARVVEVNIITLCISYLSYYLIEEKLANLLKGGYKQKRFGESRGIIGPAYPTENLPHGSPPRITGSPPSDAAAGLKESASVIPRAASVSSPSPSVSTRLQSAL
jgi:peptidoglycan/LPS O-acetylase OafA/YrhL